DAGAVGAVKTEGAAVVAAHDHPLAGHQRRRDHFRGHRGAPALGAGAGIQGHHFAVAAVGHHQAVADPGTAADAAVGHALAPEAPGAAVLAARRHRALPQRLAGIGVHGHHIAVVVVDVDAIALDRVLLAQAHTLLLVAEVQRPDPGDRDSRGNLGEIDRLQRLLGVAGKPAPDGAATADRSGHGQGENEGTDTHALKPPAGRATDRRHWLASVPAAGGSPRPGR